MPLVGRARIRAYDDFVRSLAVRGRPVRIVLKSSAKHQRWVDRALRVLSLGGQDRYLTDYVTTLGHVIYVPDEWERWEHGHRLAILRHELIHVEQFERFGVLGMSLLYGLVPFPIGFAYVRARLELEAYRETIRATAEISGLEEATSVALREHIVERFVGPDYLYMWPFRRTVTGWIDAEQAVVRDRFVGGLVVE